MFENKFIEKQVECMHLCVWVTVSLPGKEAPPRMALCTQTDPAWQLWGGVRGLLRALGLTEQLLPVLLHLFLAVEESVLQSAHGLC